MDSAPSHTRFTISNTAAANAIATSSANAIAADNATVDTNAPARVENLDIALTTLVREIELARYLNATKSVDDFSKRIRGLLQPIGITDFAHACLSHPSDTLDPFGTYDPNITDKFAQEGFHQDDLAVRHLLINRTPVFRAKICDWIDSAPFDNEIFRKHREVTRFMERHGLKDVYNVPIIHEGGYNACFSMSSHMCDPTLFQQIVNKNIANIHLLGRLVDSIGSRKFENQFHNAKINPRLPIHAKPLQLLQTMADKGCTLNEAAAVCGIKISTANQHIAAIKKALRAYTTHGMIMEAQKEGLIQVQR